MKILGALIRTRSHLISVLVFPFVVPSLLFLLSLPPVLLGGVQDPSALERVRRQRPQVADAVHQVGPRSQGVRDGRPASLETLKCWKEVKEQSFYALSAVYKNDFVSDSLSDCNASRKGIRLSVRHVRFCCIRYAHAMELTIF